MSWQLMSSRVDYSWDRQVELSLDQALAVSRTVSQQLARRRRAPRGMTLIEIIVVITILSLLMAAVGVAVIPRLE